MHEPSVLPYARASTTRARWLARLDPLARRFRPLRVLVALVALGLGWRILRYALGFPFWGDEAFVAINFITRDFSGMVRPLEWGQIVPLGFMWAELAISRLAGLPEWSLRLLPTLASLAALRLFARFAWRVLPRRAAVLAVGILAASAYVVRHGAEVKPYETDLLISLALTMLAWSVWTHPSCRRRWAGLILAGGLAVWCSYPAAFVAGAIGLLLAARLVSPVRATSRTGANDGATPAGDRSATARFVVGTLLYGIVLLASFAAMYATYARPHALAAARLTEIETWTQAFPPLAEPWKLPLWLAAIHTGLMFAYPHGGTAPGSIATFALVVVGAVQLWRMRQRALLWLLLGPLPLTFVAAAMKAYPYGGSARVSLFMAPAICLLAGLGLWALLVRLLDGALRRHAFNAVAIALGVFMIAGMAADVRAPYQSRDTLVIRERVRELARLSRPGDVWIAFNATQPCDYAPWLGEWRGTGGQFVFDVMRLARVPVTWAPRPEDVAPAGGGRVWLFAYRGVRVEFPQEQFAEYLRGVAARFGEPAAVERTILKERDGRLEAIDVYRFEPAGE